MLWIRNSAMSFSSVAPNSSTHQHDPSVLTLYQYAICPYCNIAKAMLHYGRLPYQAVEVNPLTKAELKDFSKDYRKVPIMTVGTSTDATEQLNGSEVIVDHVLKQFATTTTTSTIRDFDSTSESATKWTEFARDDLAPLLYPKSLQYGWK